MNASQTKFQEKEGIKDSNDKFFEETLKGGKGTNDQELLRYFVDHSAEAIDWLDTKGITLSNLTITGGMSEKRTHRPADGSAIGGYLVDGLVRNVREEKIPLFVDADVTDLVEENGQIDGVKVKMKDDKEKQLKQKQSLSQQVVSVPTKINYTIQTRIEKLCYNEPRRHNR